MFARHLRRASYTSIASCLALALAAGAITIAGCSTDSSEPTDAPPEETAQASEALSSGGDLFAITSSGLEQGSAGGAFLPAGDAYGVTALAGFHGHLYVASAGELWMRGAIGLGTGNDWTHVGAARGAVAMTYHQGQLYMVAQNQLWQRSAVVPGNDWTAVGDAYGVTGMASFAGQLYVASGNALWRRGAIGPGTGNDWSYAGDAYGVTAMASSGGHLYVASNNKLWQRGLIGPGTGNDWTLAGDAPGFTALTSFPVDCTAGFSAADCPSPGLDLTGLADVAIGHPAKQSSILAGQTPDRAVDADVTTAAATNVEPSPWLSIDLTFDRSVKAVALSTDTADAIVDLVDASGAVVFSEPLSAFTSSRGMYILGIAPVTARSVRVRASSTVSLNVREVQVFAPLLPDGVTRVPPMGTCWKSTYGRGAGAPISSCDADQDHDGALCYPKCASGYYGVGPVCWQSCPDGWTDTGAFCHHDGSIISANNSSCPGYDVCGLTFARGCSTCPPGYANDGCTCRIDPQDFAKGTYTRGAGVPLHCTDTQEEQAALCYTPCSTGYDGVGPVCWSQCHGDFSVPCGSLACASSADACSGFLQETVDSTVNFAITVASLFGPSASLDTIGFAFSIANSVQIKGVKALTDEIANLIIAASLRTSLGGGGSISQDLANTTAGAIVTALQTGKINWSLIDPTGLAAVIAAFDQPTC